MKRLLVLALTIMMTLSLFISCQNQPSNDSVATVRLVRQADSRKLQASIENVDEKDLVWYYSATKKSETSFKYGETTKTKLTSIENSTIELSQGKWIFTLWAEKSSSDTTVVYKGTSAETLVVKNDNSEPTIVEVEVSSEIEDTTGSIVFQNIAIELRSDGGFVSSAVIPSHVAYKKTSDDNFGSAISYASGTEVKNLAAGKYDVTVYYTGSDNVTYATEVKTITVESGRATTVTGTIVETTSSAKFDVKIIKKVVEATISANAETKITATAAPVSSKDAVTEVSFPSGSITGSKATLTMEVSQVGSNFEITGSDTSGSQAVAKLDLSLDVDGQNTTEFNSQEVTVTTYIAKNLTNVSVKYNGTALNSDKVTYTAESGKLVFKTTHFSEYVVTTSDSFEAFNRTTNVGYKTLEEAVSAAVDGNTIILLKDISSIDKTIDVKKNIAIDLNKKTIKSDKRVFFVHAGSLTVKNGTIEADIKSDSDSSVIRISCSDCAKSSNLIGFTLASDATIKGTNSYGVTAFGINDAKLEIYGNIESLNACISGNGAVANTGKITVNVYDSAVLKATGASTYDSVAIYQPNDGELNIYGGQITSTNASAVEIRAGVANISGGSLSGSNSSYEVKANGNGKTTVGAALAVSQHATKKDIVVDITGGTFTGKKQIAVVNPQNNSVDDLRNILVIVEKSAGEITDVDATASVTLDSESVKVYCATLETAIALVEKGSTITLLSDTVEVLNDTSSKADGCDTRLYFDSDNVTLDFNNHKLVIKSNHGGSYNTLNVFGTGCTIKNGEIVAFRKSSGTNVETTNTDYDKDYPYWDSYAFVVERTEEGTCTIDSMKLHGGVALYEKVTATFKNTTSVMATNYYAIYQEGAKSVIEGGTFTAAKDSPIIYCNKNHDYSVTINGGSFTGTVFNSGVDMNKITISGNPTFTIDPRSESAK